MCHDNAVEDILETNIQGTPLPLELLCVILIANSIPSAQSWNQVIQVSIRFTQDQERKYCLHTKYLHFLYLLVQCSWGRNTQSPSQYKGSQATTVATQLAVQCTKTAKILWYWWKLQWEPMWQAIWNCLFPNKHHKSLLSKWKLNSGNWILNTATKSNHSFEIL